MNRNFFLLISGQGISQIGNSVFYLALSWFLLSQENGTREFATIMLVNAIPGIVFPLFFGIVIDRLPKKWILFFSDFFRSIVFIVMSYLYYINRLDFCSFIILGFLNSIFSVVFDPTLSATIPFIVEKGRLEKANSISNGLMSISGLIGLFLGGVLLQFIGVGGVLIFNSVSFLCAAFFEFCIQVPYFKSGKILNFSGFYGEIKESIIFVVKNPAIPYIMGIGLVLTLFIYPAGNVIFPILLKNTIKVNELFFSFIQSGYPLGIIIGTAIIFLGKSETRKNPLGLMVVCSFIMGFNVLIWGLISRFYAVNNWANILILTLSVIFMGILTIIIGIKAMTYMQANTPKRMLGKVFSLYQMFSSSLVPLGVMLYSIAVISLGAGVIFFYAFLIVVFLTLLIYIMGKWRAIKIEKVL